MRIRNASQGPTTFSSLIEAFPIAGFRSTVSFGLSIKKWLNECNV